MVAYLPYQLQQRIPLPCTDELEGVPCWGTSPNGTPCVGKNGDGRKIEQTWMFHPQWIPKTLPARSKEGLNTCTFTYTHSITRTHTTQPTLVHHSGTHTLWDMLKQAAAEVMLPLLHMYVHNIVPHLMKLRAELHNYTLSSIQVPNPFKQHTWIGYESESLPKRQKGLSTIKPLFNN